MDFSDHIQEHMEVVGSDGKHVGTVDHLDGDKLKLTKSDPAAGGKHHFLGVDRIDHVEQNKVCLNVSADHAMKMWN